MKQYRIAYIPGDGIGKETGPEGLRVLEAAARKFGFALKFDEYDIVKNNGVNRISLGVGPQMGLMQAPKQLQPPQQPQRQQSQAQPPQQAHQQQHHQRIGMPRRR